MSEPNLTALRDQIVVAFDEEELRDLCFALGVDYDNLGGRGKAANVRELIAHCQRRHLLTDLQFALIRTRPAIDWPGFLPPSTLATSAQQQQTWQEAAQTYLDKLYTQVNWLHVLGKPEGHQLERIYTDVNVLDKLSAEKWYSLEQLEEDFVPRQGWRWREKERRDGLKVAAENQHLFILGKPGSGKTTFLKHVTVQTIKQYKQKDGEKKLPIFVSLKELSDSGQPIIPFIAEQFRRAGFAEAKAFVRQLLRGGDAVVLLDGLDEVNAEDQQRAKLSRDIQYFVEEFDGCRVLVTCRLAAADYLLQHFEYVEMADFSEVQQKTFVFRWFQTDKVAQSACWQALQSTRNETLRELAQVPMLLSLLCLSFEELKEFPPNRDEIYSVAIRALLLKWDSSRSIQRDKSYETLTLKHKERLLAWLAAETFENGKHFMKEAQLARLIEGYLQKVPEVTDPDGRELLRQIETQHGLLVQRAQTIYSFSHLTLQEYFTAQYIVDNVARGSLGRLMVHVGDDRWREVFLLIATMLEDATDFCQKYLSALEKILLQDETLLAMLRWAASKSVDKHTDIEPLAMRAFALYIALSVDRDFALSVDRASAHNIDLNLGLNQIFDRAIVANRAIDFNRAFGLALGREHNRTRRLDSARARDLALALARALILDRTRDSTLELSLLDDLPDSILDITFYLRIWAKETGLIELNQALQTLVIPNENAPEEAWQTLNEQLEKIILAYRGLDAFWILSQEQANVMITFLNATYLLKQCITVAYLPHKEWFENQLLLPPSNR